MFVITAKSTIDGSFKGRKQQTRVLHKADRRATKFDEYVSSRCFSLVTKYISIANSNVTTQYNGVRNSKSHCELRLDVRVAYAMRRQFERTFHFSRNLLQFNLQPIVDVNTIITLIL